MGLLTMGLLTNRAFDRIPYKILHQARTNQRGGGVGIVYKGGLDVVKIDSSDGTTLLEYLTCKVSLHKKRFVLCSIYRSLPYLTRVPYHVDVGCYLTIQTKLLYLLSGGSVLLASFLSSFAGTSGRFPSGGPELSCLLHSL